MVALSAQWGHSEYVKDILDFDNRKICGIDPVLAGPEVFTEGVTGIMKDILAQFKRSNLGTYTVDSSWGSSSNLFGGFELTNPLIITNQAKDLEVTFSISSIGMTIIPDGSGGMQRFDGGPISLAFKIF